MGAGVRELGYAVSSAKNESEGRIDVKAIAKKADKYNLPRETSRYLRAGSSNSDFSGTSLDTRKASFEKSGRSGSLSSIGSQTENSRGKTASSDDVNSMKVETPKSPSSSPMKSFASESSKIATKVQGKSDSLGNNSSTSADKNSLSPITRSKFTLDNSPSKSPIHSTPKLFSPVSKNSTAFNDSPEEIDLDPRRKYTLEQLQSNLVPEGVNPLKKEDSMKIAHFKKCFGVDPETFAKYPEWKKVELRKQHKIF